MLLGTVSEWWSELFTLQQVVFILACAASLLLVIQLILLLFGLGDDAGFDGDATLDGSDGFNDDGISDAGGLRLISLRTITAFLAVGGWITYTAGFFLKWYFSLPLGILAGAAAAVGVAYLLRAIIRFQSDGNRDLSLALGAVADVYLTVPEKRTGTGKIQLIVQETLTECAAVTDGDTLVTGSKCVVSEVINDGLVVVKPFNLTKDETTPE